MGVDSRKPENFERASKCDFMTIRIHTKFPVAKNSVDHLYPRGTKNDNSQNEEFNQLLEYLLLRSQDETLRILDLGCSGGGFVCSMVQRGHLVVGIEGSDYSAKTNRAEWGRSNAHQFLFTADIGEPFLVLQNLKIQIFDVVTAWEVLEHLNEIALETLAVNIHAHLKSGGFFIGSVNTHSDFFEGREYHATINDFDWWQDWFQQHGFIWNSSVHNYFGNRWIRGPNTDGVTSHTFVVQK